MKSHPGWIQQMVKVPCVYIYFYKTKNIGWQMIKFPFECCAVLNVWKKYMPDQDYLKFRKGQQGEIVYIVAWTDIL